MLYREVLQLVKNEMESRAQVKTKQQLKPINGLKHHVSDSTSVSLNKYGDDNLKKIQNSGNDFDLFSCLREREKRRGVIAK